MKPSNPFAPLTPSERRAREQQKQAACAHDAPRRREYMYGADTGDRQCQACGLAVPPRVWREYDARVSAARAFVLGGWLRQH
jgi:hypothetical protein